MLSTSQEYKEMMLSPWMRSRIEITITDGTTTKVLRDKDIIRESVSWNWRSSNNQMLGLGATYASSFSFTSLESMETGYEGKYLDITPVLYFQTGTNTEQEIPMGTSEQQHMIALITCWRWMCPLSASYQVHHTICLFLHARNVV